MTDLLAGVAFTGLILAIVALVLLARIARRSSKKE